ncbi:MAG: hypothetical protein JNL60_00740 [Bacteroidia bacterium]|nr:hypothetical protein [Bacteroidia bacterium]
MKTFFITLLACLVVYSPAYSQMQASDIRITSTTVGISAISVNSIVAKTYNVVYPVYDYKVDTLSKELFFCTRQRGEGASAYLSKGFCGAFSSQKDSLKWLNESSLFNIRLSGPSLLISNDVKSVKYNKLHGYDEMRYDSKIIYTIPKYNKGLMYSRDIPGELICTNLSLGTPSWSCSIPSSENWVDTKMLNDSVLIVAAAGIHAVDVKRGLMWSHPLSTAIKTNRSFVYSLAKYNSIQQISQVTKTTDEENQVTQIASNILIKDNAIFFASKEKMIAVSSDGKLRWQLDLKNYPVSKMFITKTDSTLILVNFGLATHSNNFVTWGKPFIITIEPNSGRIIDQYDLTNIENLADFVHTRTSLIFAGKDGIQEVTPGKTQLKTVMTLGNKYGEFVEFINGDEYYVLKEGYFVPLNFINDNPIYFRTDNNKIYGLLGEELSYEYHFTELYKLDRKYKNKTILTNPQKTLITNSIFELLYTINLPDKSVILNDKMYFMSENKIHVIDLNQLN